MDHKKNAMPEHIDIYRAKIVDFIKETKGWKPAEYSIRYSGTLTDAPLAVFQIRRYDVIDEMRKLDALGRHPTGEFEIYVQTKEVRVFSDYEEAQRIREEPKEGHE